MEVIQRAIEDVYKRQPLRRVGERGSGKWESVSWDEALDEIAEKMGAIRDTYGPEALAIISGTGRHHLAQFWRFGNVLGTPNATSSGALICLGPRKNAGDLTAGPVSYTHLDVYKRQPEKYPADPTIAHFLGRAKSGAAFVTLAGFEDSVNAPQFPDTLDMSHFPEFDLRNALCQNYMVELIEAMHYEGTLVSGSLFSATKTLSLIHI